MLFAFPFFLVLLQLIKMQHVFWSANSSTQQTFQVLKEKLILKSCLGCKVLSFLKTPFSMKNFPLLLSKRSWLLHPCLLINVLLFVFIKWNFDIKTATYELPIRREWHKKLEIKQIKTSKNVVLSRACVRTCLWKYWKLLEVRDRKQDWNNCSLVELVVNFLMLWKMRQNLKPRQHHASCLRQRK